MRSISTSLLLTRQSGSFDAFHELLLYQEIQKNQRQDCEQRAGEPDGFVQRAAGADADLVIQLVETLHELLQMHGQRRCRAG